ncbi:hypothetical protein, partial [Candidatus Rhabdochlamydia sp. W815]|uniref:hypothetical protein n=1 Tax=Candidatus Rhabdochlamydia sp. W815 TaxID=2720721 RepID=UPI001BFC1495
INVWTTGILDEFLKSASIFKTVNLIQDRFIALLVGNLREIKGNEDTVISKLKKKHFLEPV